MTEPSDENISTLRRRSFLLATALGAAGPIVSEASLAWAARASFLGDVPPDAVLINANENPLGPSKAACAAIADVAPLGGRYDRFDVNDKLIKLFADQNGLKPENIAVYAGSSEPLHYTTLAFTSPTRSLVMADPSYELPAAAAKIAGAPVRRVPLTSDYAHDVKAMVAADPAAGLIYICNPNNPTGTVTPREDILGRWPTSRRARFCCGRGVHPPVRRADRARPGGGREGKISSSCAPSPRPTAWPESACAFAIAAPDLLEPDSGHGDFQNVMPITALAAAKASLLETRTSCRRARTSSAIPASTRSPG